MLLAGALFLPWNHETRAILGGAALIAVVGAVDDAKEGGLSPLVKLAGTVHGRARAVLAGDVLVENITLPFLAPLDFGDWGIPLTLVGIVAVMNVVNFIDGVDGLAAGVCTIAAATFAIIALSLDRVDAGRARGRHGWRLGRLPAPQLPSGLRLHGRLGLQPAGLTSWL